MKLIDFTLRCFSLQSAGDLENDERTAGILLNMVRLACKVQISEEKLDFFKRLSGISRSTDILLFSCIVTKLIDVRLVLQVRFLMVVLDNQISVWTTELSLGGSQTDA